MGADNIQLQPDSTGKKVQTWSNVIGADTVHTEAHTLATSAGVEISPATEATLGTVHGHVDSIDGKITACDTNAVVLAAGADNIGGVDVVSSALPTGAATEATIHNNIEHQVGASRSVNPIDYLGITYNADGTVNVITAKTAVAGVTIYTLTCAYTSGNLTAITRT